MKNVIPVLLLILVLTYSCKTTKKTSAYQAPVAAVEETVTKPEPVKEAAKPEPVKVEKPILERTESVNVASNEDKSLGKYQFYVIAGSFSVQENANKYKRMMLDKGFTSVILTSDSGMFRVAIEQTNSEYDARVFIGKMRGIYPEHSDIWLLRRK